MARPPQANSEETKATILRVATNLFAKGGHGGTSMRQVARESGVAQATVHHYFDSKEGLYESCFQTMVADLARLIEKLRDQLEAAAPMPDRVRVAVTTAYRFAGEHRSSVRLLNRQVLEAGAGAHGSRHDLLFSFIHAATPTLVQGSRLDRAQLNMALYGLTCFLVRICAAESQELVRILPGVGRLELEAYLGELAVRMLGCDEQGLSSP